MTTKACITIPAPIERELRAHLLQGASEEVAVVFAHQASRGDTTNLVAARWLPVPREALLVQAPDQFAVDSSFIVRQVKGARVRQESLLLAHSHPMESSVPWFSYADKRGEDNLYPLLQQRLPGRVPGAIVVAPGGISARLLAPDGAVVPAAVRIVGRRIKTYRCPTEDRHGTTPPEPQHARQALMWGSHGQGLLRQANIGVIGAGGTGSVVAQQLIHLGVGRLTIIDPEVLEHSNLARVVGARHDDVGRTPKVDVVARTARLVDPSIKVRALAADACRNSVLRELVDADLLFLCTHGHYSRAVLNAFAVQYCIPLVDLGFRITMNSAGDRIASAVGEVRLVVPGGYCLSCAGVLDAERISAEKASPEERAAHPDYFADVDIPDPSVITVNSVIASMAVSVGLDMLIPTMTATSALDSYRFNALKGLVTHVSKEKDDTCGICGAEGLGDLADDHPLPGRQD